MQVVKTRSTEDSDEISRAFELMPVLREIRDRFATTKPLRDARVAVVFHLTREAACLALTLHAGGAEVRFIPSKLATVERRVERELMGRAVQVSQAESEQQRAEHLRQILAFAPHMVVDNADLFSLWHEVANPPPLLCASLHSRGACAVAEAYWEQHKEFLFPVIAVGSSPMKLELESSYGTGQSVVAALIQAAGLQLSGKNVVVIGYGNVGSGIAEFAKGLNARVVVVQRSAFRALKAVMDGYEVLPLSQALARADVVLTATGVAGIIGEEQFRVLRDGVLLGNVGREQEIDVARLSRLATHTRTINETLVEYEVAGKRIVLMGNGHQFNHMAHSANTSEIMDLSLSLHALSLEHVWNDRPDLSHCIHPVPAHLAERVAQSKLDHLGIRTS